MNFTLHVRRSKTPQAVATAVLAAALYGISTPVSKLLLAQMPPVLLAALLYLGAGLGMSMIALGRAVRNREQVEAGVTRRELPYVLGMVLLDTAAPILLMRGLTLTTSANASLLNSFEIVATSLIALLVFREAVGKRMWWAIALVTAASMILAIDDYGSLSFSVGSLLVLLACICWGLENNCTRMLSLKDPVQIVVIKGFGSGGAALGIALLAGAYSSTLLHILLALVVGFVAYGLSIYLYVSAQRELGAARTSAYYAAAPFIGVLVSWIALREAITLPFLVALGMVCVGMRLAVTERHGHVHAHLEHVHAHRHAHDDAHHNHTHTAHVLGEHAHVHQHEVVEHEHAHMPDAHHRHVH
ncbi:MAG: DMT family transporter [Anaerolineae bacterium]